MNFRTVIVTTLKKVFFPGLPEVKKPQKRQRTRQKCILEFHTSNLTTINFSHNKGSELTKNTDEKHFTYIKHDYHNRNNINF